MFPDVPRHVYTYIYICIHIYIYTYIYIYVYAYIYIYVYTFIYIYIYMYICIHIYIYIVIYVYIYIWICVYTYVHVYIYIHIHIYTYTYIYIYISAYVLYIHIFIYLHMYIYVYKFTIECSANLASTVAYFSHFFMSWAALPNWKTCTQRNRHRSRLWNQIILRCGRRIQFYQNMLQTRMWGYHSKGWEASATYTTRLKHTVHDMVWHDGKMRFRV